MLTPLGLGTRWQPLFLAAMVPIVGAFAKPFFLGPIGLVRIYEGEEMNCDIKSEW